MEELHGREGYVGEWEMRQGDWAVHGEEEGGEWHGEEEGGSGRKSVG